jgi:signal transduction histidine kinase
MSAWEHRVMDLGRRAVPWLIGLAGLAVGVFAELDAHANGLWSTERVVIDFVVAFAVLAAGIASWQARPESLAGPLLTVGAGVWFLGVFGYSNDMALVDLVGFPLQGWFDVLLIVLLVLLPTSPQARRLGFAAVVGVAASHLLLSLDRLLLRPPLDPSSCFCIPNRILPITDPTPYQTVDDVARFAEVAFAVLAVGVLGYRFVRATPVARRVTGLVLAAGIAACGVIAYHRVLTRLDTSISRQTGDAMYIALALVRAGVPIAIMVALLRARRARGRAASVVLALSGGGLPAAGPALQRALADPGVRLLRWLPDDHVYIDADGLPVAAPERGFTVLERDGERLGALVHDAALTEEPEVLEVVAAAAALALHNERLADEVRAQLDEVSASRQRIAEAAEVERARIERDLHDGAQQRLIALSMRARSLERAATNPDLAARARALAEGLGDALREVRELAHGIRPPMLAELGLGAALDELATRTPLDVALDVELPSELPDPVAATAYFAASEAVANALKHAHAKRLRITARAGNGMLMVRVADDGVGGVSAAPAALRDRVAALHGNVTVHSPAGSGTEVVVSLPTGVGQDRVVARR